MQHLLGLTQTRKDSYSLLQEENCVLKNLQMNIKPLPALMTPGGDTTAVSIIERLRLIKLFLPLT